MAKKKYRDFQEEIGSYKINVEKEKMVDSIPEPLEEVYLSAGIDKDAMFEMPDNNWTEERLKQAMDEQREYYLPFFKDHAPKIENTRTRQELVEFQWRVGTEEDAADFSRVLKGEGEWETVKIPHFGPPLGYAVTYYRTEFELTQEELDKEAKWICFKGVDYKAKVYINDACVGTHEGFFAPFEFDFTKLAKAGKNVCVVVVENDFIPMGSKNEYRGEVYSGDKVYAETGLGYDEPLVGWHHCPPGMGIWQGVSIEGRNEFFVQDIFVRPLTYEKAEIWVELYGMNVGLRKITADVSVYGQNFEETVFEHMEHIPETVSFVTLENTQLRMERGINYLKIPIEIPEARLWEPNTPWLYQVQIRLLDEKKVILDAQKRQFGMRLVHFDTNCSPKGMFYLNGKKIRFRGVNSQGREQRKVFLGDLDGLFEDYLLAKVGNINYLRITQRPVQPEVYDCCDKIGLLVQTDFPGYGSMRRNQMVECIRQAQEMEHLIRSHPCCIVATYINERFENSQDRPHRCMTREEMETFFTCASMMIHILNPDRIIKPVDGDYDPPCSEGLPDYHCYTCWYNGHAVDIGRLHQGYWSKVKEGWNYACGEYGMEGLDPVSVIKKYYPKEWLPENDDDTWTPANIPGDPPPQLGFLHYAFYETPRTMAEWTEASQIYQAQAMRLMTRAYRRNPRMVSFAYHLFIDAYPDGWMKAMVDVERTPKKAFWEFRSACAPVMMDLRCDRFKLFSGETLPVEAWICNDPDEVLENAKMHYQVILGDKMILAGSKDLSVPGCDVEFQGYIPVTLPQVEHRTDLIIQAAVIDADGKVINSDEIKLEVFPATKESLGKVCLLGATEAFAEKLAAAYAFEEVKLEDIDQDTAIVACNFEKYQESEEKILEAVEKGAKVLLMHLPLGTQCVAGHNIEVTRCINGPVHFVTRSKTHEWTKDLKTNDVRYWYNEDMGCISPVLSEVFETEGFEPVLTSAKRERQDDRYDPKSWRMVPAIARKKLGKGDLIVSQIDFSNRIATNPVAKLLLGRMLKK